MFKRIYSFKFKFILLVLLVLVLLQLFTAYIFGYITQTQMDYQFSHLSESPLIKVKQREYHRGIFSSDSTTEISLNSQMLATIFNILPKNETESIAALANQEYSIKYTTHIEHGIFAGLLNGYFMPTLAYAKTTIIYPDSVKNILSKFFNNKPPLAVDNLIYLDKSGRYEVYSPKFDYSEAVSGVKVTWGGMDLRIKYNDKFDKFNTKVSVPLFELIAPTKGSATIKNLVYRSDSATSANRIKVGDTHLTLDLAKVEWKDKVALNFKLGDMLHTLTGISSTEFLNGIGALDPNNFMFTHVSYTSKSSDENNYFSAFANASFESLVTNSRIYGPMDLDIAVDHIAAAEFSQLIDRVTQISMTNTNGSQNQNKMQDELVKVLKQYGGPILVEKPIIKLEKFNLITPDGAIEISGVATTDGFTLKDMNDQSKFMQKMNLDIHLSVPKPILSYLFVLQMRYLLSAGNAQMDKQSSEALTKVVNILLDNQISIWVKKGYLTNSNGVLITHMYVKNGKLYLNDKLSE